MSNDFYDRLKFRIFAWLGLNPDYAPGIYHISRTNLPCAVITSCAFIYFWEFSCPVRLFHTMRLLDNVEYVNTFCFLIFSPRCHHEGVIDRNTKDFFNSFGFQIISLLNISREMGLRTTENLKIVNWLLCMRYVHTYSKKVIQPHPMLVYR